MTPSTSGPSRSGASTASRVVVLGSANADLMLRVDRLPGAGETVLATGSSRLPGGKGANQAVAATRAGASTTLIAAIGDDADVALEHRRPTIAVGDRAADPFEDAQQSFLGCEQHLLGTDRDRQLE